MKKQRLRSRQPRLTAVRIYCADHATPSTRIGTNFADKRWSIGGYTSLADYGHGVLFNLFNTFLKQYKNTTYAYKGDQTNVTEAPYIQVMITHSDKHNIWIHIQCIIQ
jgi:hypothetical protein